MWDLGGLFDRGRRLDERRCLVCMRAVLSIVAAADVAAAGVVYHNHGECCQHFVSAGHSAAAVAAVGKYYLEI